MIGISKWMQVAAVALASVVGVVPAIVQLGYAQAVSSSSVVLPVGDELEDTVLAEVDGEAWPALVPLVKVAKWMGTALIAAERLASSGCQKVVQVAGQAVAKIGQLTLQGLSFTAQHPLATTVGVGATGGGLMGGLTSPKDSLPERLVDVGLGVLGGGRCWRVVVRHDPPTVAQSEPLSPLDANGGPP